MWYVPAVLSGPICFEPLLICTLATVGAPGSLDGCALLLTQLPLARIWKNDPSSTTVSIEPLETLTQGCAKLVATICAVPFGQPFDPVPPPPLLDGVLLPPPAVLLPGVPGRVHAANKILPIASAASIIIRTRIRLSFILILPLKI